MKVVERLRTWWQEKTGEEDTPFDGDAPVWVVSMVVHLVLMLVLAFITVASTKPQLLLTIASPLQPEEEKIELPEQFAPSEQPHEEIGANSVNGTEMAQSEAAIVSTISEIASPKEIDTVPEVATVEINNALLQSTGLTYNQNRAVKGLTGAGTTGAVGAIDRITHEIMLSLEERPTLVVWMFDQTASLIPQRKSINERFDRIYEELGVIEAAGNPAFKKHDDKPLLTAVIGFGQAVTLFTKKPTDNLAEIKQAVSDMPNDDSGMEQVFSATYMAAEKFKDYRLPDHSTGKPKRNVMLIAITDEAGSDQILGLDKTVQICRRYEMPVYVVGVPAPFGRKETKMKWVNTDPKYKLDDAQWGIVEQGPESFMPERIKLEFSGGQKDEDDIDSGFGPYALTRLCYETGGIYFAVHPNRNVNKAVSKNETEAFSSHLSHFFDPEVMRKYRPDYVSANEYQKRLSQNKARQTLVEAATFSMVQPVDKQEMRFVKRDEAAFSNALSEAQKGAAKLEPVVNAMYERLKLGEPDRSKETTPRWQAGYDLAMGRVMAVKVRTETYNAMLAAAKRGLKFKNEKNNTWVLEASNEISVGSQAEKMGAKAKEYLERVVKEHPNTPWALLAKRELDTPLGFTWKEEFTPVAPERMGGGGNAAAPANDKAMMLKKEPPRAPLPKL